MGLTSNTGFYNPAAEKFGVDDPVMVKAPRMKYQFKLEFVLNENVFIEDDSFGRTFTFDRVMSASMPDFDYGLQTLNQYNRMRHVPTRMTIGTVNVGFYDTKDNQFSTLMKAYAGHYFGSVENGVHDLDPRNFSGYEIMNTRFGVGDSHPFGAKSISADSRFFFEEIRIFNTDTAQGGRITNCYNNMIVNVQADTLDMGASIPVVYNVTFQPEHANIGALGSSDTISTAAAQQNLQSSIAATVSNRQASVNNNVLGQRIYRGEVLAADEVIRNINGESFIVKTGPQ